MSNTLVSPCYGQAPTAPSTTMHPRALAKSSTRHALGAAREHLSVYAWRQDLVVDRVTVPHVVTTSAGAFAVESLAEGVLRHDLEVAQQSATVVRSALAARGYSVPVRALVVVWGDASADVPAGGTTMGDAIVLAGDDLDEFLGRSGEADRAWSRSEAAPALRSLGGRLY